MSDGLFTQTHEGGHVRHEVSGRAWLNAMLDAEAALAGACADFGVIPTEAAEVIASACADPGPYDETRLGALAAETGNPVVGLVTAIRQALPSEFGDHVHFGATSQDIIDTAAMLVARRAITVLGKDIAGCAEAAADLAVHHRDTPMVARTLLQQAVPTTFGLKAAGWLDSIGAADRRLSDVQAGLPAQLGGAAGNLGGYPDPETGWKISQAFAARLGLAAPQLPWHTNRYPIGNLAGALATTAGIVGKIALDVVLLAQSEVAEITVAVDGRGASSTMAHKQNPVAAVAARAAAKQAPGLAATLFAAMEQEHERAAGAWQAEWPTLSRLLTCTGSAAFWLRDALETMHPDVARMAANLAEIDSDASTAGAAALVDRALSSYRRTTDDHDNQTDSDEGDDLMGAVALHHQITGEPGAPAVLLLNTLGGTLEMWERQLPALAERFLVIRCDSRGHGESPVPPGPYEIDDLVDDAEALLDNLDIERAHVGGVSLGGMVGMRLAARNPERVDRLALICTSAHMGPPQMWADRAATVRAEGTAAIADMVAARWLTDAHKASKPQTLEQLRDMIASTPADGYVACCDVIRDMDLRGDLAAIKAPTLVVSGADDPSTPLEHQRSIVAGISGARHVVIPDCAHLAPIDQPEAVTAALLEHFWRVPHGDATHG